MNSWLNSCSYENHETRMRVLGWMFVLSMLCINGGAFIDNLFIAASYDFGQQCAAYAMGLGVVLFATLILAGAGEFMLVVVARRKLGR